MSFTNWRRLSDGRAQVELLLPTNGLYTMLASADLKSWTEAWMLPDHTSRALITSQKPLAGDRATFLRAAFGRVAAHRLLLSFFAQPGTVTGTNAPLLRKLRPECNVLLSVENAEAVPEAAEVLFTGPSGSGILDLPADHQGGDRSAYEAWYEAHLAKEPPWGSWLVKYGATNLRFDLIESKSVGRFVALDASFTVNAGLLTAVSWQFRDPQTGEAIAGSPSPIEEVWLNIHSAADPGGLATYESPELEPDQRHHALATPQVWDGVARVVINYADVLGNTYSFDWSKIP